MTHEPGADDPNCFDACCFHALFSLTEGLRDLVAKIIRVHFHGHGIIIQ
jgi:hypothetical protein